MNFSERINDVIGAQGIEWNIKLSNECYTLVPNTQQCCVHSDVYHAFERLSGIEVYKSRAVCYCNVHGKRVIESELSLRIRNLFFIKKPSNYITPEEKYDSVCDCVYFIVSRHVVLKDKLYCKFGNYEFGREKHRFLKYDTHNPSYMYAFVSYNTRAIHECCGHEYKYVDNYIYRKMLKDKISIPIIYYKNTDWFEITQEASENIFDYIKEINKNNRHPMLSDGEELEVFIHNIRKYIEADNTIKNNYSDTCECCGGTRYTKVVCFGCSATTNVACDYIHMSLSLGPDDNVYGKRHVYFVKKPDSIMFIEDFRKKFFNWLRLKYHNAKYTWTSDYSAFKRWGFEVVRTKICKTCKKESHRDCCSNYDKDNRSTRTIIKNIACIEEER